MQSANSSKPLALGWLMRAHLQQCELSILYARVYHATAQGHSTSQVATVLGAQPLAADKSRCPISVR